MFPSRWRSGVAYALGLYCVACGESDAGRAPLATSCLMPTPDASTWSLCAADAALRDHPTQATVDDPAKDNRSEDEAGPSDAGVATKLDASEPAGEVTDPEYGASDAAVSLMDATPPLSDTGLAAAPVAPPVRDLDRACATPEVCPRVEYPCVRADDDGGYACQGQYAAWPMPDAVPGAKVAPKYQLQEDGRVVLDEVTGLVWQREPPDVYDDCTGTSTQLTGATCSWSEAVHYCETLQLAGRRWRLPSLIELVSLLDHTKTDDLTAPLINTDFFADNSDDHVYWSVSRVIPETVPPDAVSQMNFLIGYDIAAPRTMAGAVRCVSTARVVAAPVQRFAIDRAAGTALDIATGLQWQIAAAPSASTWDDAESYCARSARRVPTLKELYTALDHGQDGLAVDPLFEDPSLDTVLFSASIGRFGMRLYFSPNLGGVRTQSAVDEPRYELNTHVRCVR